jgi:hypothetical protein
MDPSTKDNGLRIKHLVMEGYFMLMEICMKGNGWKTRQMGEGSTTMQMERCTMENGSTINRKVMESRIGMTDNIIVVCTTMAKRMAKVHNFRDLGLFTWKDGSSYDGDFKDNMIEGYGVYIWDDGRKYRGEWV